MPPAMATSWARQDAFVENSTGLSKQGELGYLALRADAPDDFPDSFTE